MCMCVCVCVCVCVCAFVGSSFKQLKASLGEKIPPESFCCKNTQPLLKKLEKII